MPADAIESTPLACPTICPLPKWTTWKSSTASPMSLGNAFPSTYHWHDCDRLRPCPVDAAGSWG
eukprot:5711481-Heterocapsa_arctica.AAC.1